MLGEQAANVAKIIPTHSPTAVWPSRAHSKAVREKKEIVTRYRVRISESRLVDWASSNGIEWSPTAYPLSNSPPPILQSAEQDMAERLALQGLERRLQSHITPVTR